MDDDGSIRGDRYVMADWGVIVTEPQRHRVVAEGLAASAIDYFIPMEEVTTISRGRHNHHIRPLLGRYMLFAIDQTWRSVLSVRGVAGMLFAVGCKRDRPSDELVGNQEDVTPAIVLPAQLAALRSLCVNGKYIKPEPKVEEPKPLVIGEVVTPTEGPLAFLHGRYAGVASKRREAALFYLFGREQTILFKAGNLISAQ